MKFQTLKKRHLKRNIIIGILVIGIISAIIPNFTRAKYQLTQSIPLVNGTINYSPFDIKVIAYYKNEKLSEFPNANTVSFESITCDKNASATFDEKNMKIVVSNLTDRGTTCNIYFKEKVSTKATILANYSTILTRDNFATTVTNTTTGTIYKSLDKTQYDNDGEVYYFAGNPTDNWVKFAGFYWRIIRINGDGTIRMIYQGTKANKTGINTQLSTTTKFNNYYKSPVNVGLKYTDGEQHGQNTNSTILTVLNNWYNTNNLNKYSEYIDNNTGFCSDRELASGNYWGSSQTGTLEYAARERLFSEDNPIFKCNNSSDILQIPVGLITADEAIYAGMTHQIHDILARDNYLYTGQDYWTMTPDIFHNGNESVVYTVSSNAWLDTTRVNHEYTGVRPVINLKADIQLTGSGTTTDPFVVKGAE